MFRRLGNFLDRLNAGCAGADYGDALSFEADRFMRPGGRVIGLARETVDALDVRQGRLREHTDRGNQEAGFRRAPVFRFDCP